MGRGWGRIVRFRLFNFFLLGLALCHLTSAADPPRPRAPFFTQSWTPCNVLRKLAVQGDSEKYTLYQYMVVRMAAGFKNVPKSENGLYIVRYSLDNDLKNNDANDFHIEIEPYGKTSRFLKEVQDHLKLVKKRYRDKDIVSDAEIDRFLATEEKLDPTRVEYIAYPDRVTGETDGVIRIFHGSPETSYGGQLDTGGDSYKLPLEREFPDLKLPEREKDGDKAYLVEMGRLAGSENTSHVMTTAFYQVARRLFEQYVRRYGKEAVARYLGNRAETMNDDYPTLPGFLNGPPGFEKNEGPKNTVIYAEATAEGTKVYQDAGFQIFRTPEELGIKPGENPKFIIRADLRDFLKQWYRPDLIHLPTKSGQENRWGQNVWLSPDVKVTPELGVAISDPKFTKLLRTLYNIDSPAKSERLTIPDASPEPLPKADPETIEKAFIRVEQRLLRLEREVSVSDYPIRNQGKGALSEQEKKKILSDPKFAEDTLRRLLAMEQIFPKALEALDRDTHQDKIVITRVSQHQHGSTNLLYLTTDTGRNFLIYLKKGESGHLDVESVYLGPRLDLVGNTLGQLRANGWRPTREMIMPLTEEERAMTAVAVAGERGWRFGDPRADNFLTLLNVVANEFWTRSNLDQYVGDFGPKLGLELANAMLALGPEHTWLDGGSGENGAISTYLANLVEGKKHFFNPLSDWDAQSQSKAEAIINELGKRAISDKAQVVGISYSTEPGMQDKVLDVPFELDSSYNLSSEGSKKLRKVTGELFEEIAPDAKTATLRIGKVELITDVNGSFSISFRPQLILQRYVDLLKVGGSAFILTQPVKARAANGSYTGPFVSKSRDVGRWLAAQHIPGLKVEFDRNGFRIIKEAEGVVIPDIPS